MLADLFSPPTLVPRQCGCHGIVNQFPIRASFCNFTVCRPSLFLGLIQPSPLATLEESWFLITLVFFRFCFLPPKSVVFLLPLTESSGHHEMSVCLKLPILNFIYAIHSSHQPILALSAKDPFLLMLVHLLLIESM